MKLKIYWELLKDVLDHKRNVFKVCWNKGMYKHAILHDISKFSPKEFFAYANWFHGELGVKYKEYEADKAIVLLYPNIITRQQKVDKHKELKRNFDKAWQHHKDHNKHHWNYWSERNLEMPKKYIDQMICDWEAMGIKFGNTALEFYKNNRHKIKMSDVSRRYLHWKLGFHEERNTFTSDDVSRWLGYGVTVGGYLQSGYGIWIHNCKGEQIGHIHDFVAPNKKNVLGHDIIVGNIVIYDDECASKALADQFMGRVLKCKENESIW